MLSDGSEIRQKASEFAFNLKLSETAEGSRYYSSGLSLVLCEKQMARPSLAGARAEISAMTAGRAEGQLITLGLFRASPPRGHRCSIDPFGGEALFHRRPCYQQTLSLILCF